MSTTRFGTQSFTTLESPFLDQEIVLRGPDGERDDASYEAADEGEGEYIEGEDPPTPRARMKFEIQISGNKIFRNDGSTSEALPRKYGRDDFLVARAIGDDETGLRLETDTDGDIEFETEWFSKWSKHKKAIELALQMTKEMSKPVAAKYNTSRRKFPFDADIGHLRTPWKQKPGRQHSAHETPLKPQEVLEVDLTDDKWIGRIQASEGFMLEYYESLLRQHEHLAFRDDTINHAQAILDEVTPPGTPAVQLVKLRSLLQIIVNYILRGRKLDRTGHVAKSTFWLMCRTRFDHIYSRLLTSKERALFDKIVNTKAILKKLGLNQQSRFFIKGFGVKPPLHDGPTVHDWLHRMRYGKDLLSGEQNPGSGLSDAMGAHNVDTAGPDKYQVKFEIRGSVLGNDHEAAKWLDYASKVFDLASKREQDATSLAFQRGITAEGALTNFVFHARHPELKGRRIKQSEAALGQEWTTIREQLVRPLLPAPQPELSEWENEYAAMEADSAHYVGD